MQSQKFSFDGWSVWEFIKGRKKTAIALVAAALGYVIADSNVVAIAAGGLVEMGWGIVEYYFKKMNY